MKTLFVWIILISAATSALELGQTIDEVQVEMGVDPYKKAIMNTGATYYWRTGEATAVRCEFDDGKLVAETPINLPQAPPLPYIGPKMAEYLTERQERFNLITEAKFARRFIDPAAWQKHLADGPQEVFFGSDWDFDVGRIGYLPTISVVQIVDDNTALVSLNMGDILDTMFLLKGWNMDSHADDDRLVIPILVEVTGTQQYETVIGGSKTVYVIESYEIEVEP